MMKMCELPQRQANFIQNAGQSSARRDVFECAYLYLDVFSTFMHVHFPLRRANHLNNHLQYAHTRQNFGRRHNAASYMC